MEVVLTAHKGKAGTLPVTTSQTQPYPTRFWIAPTRRAAHKGKTSHKLPAKNPTLSPKSLATPSLATCLWLQLSELFITGDMLPNKYPIPAHDCNHIAATNTSHLLFTNETKLSLQKHTIVVVSFIPSLTQTLSLSLSLSQSLHTIASELNSLRKEKVEMLLIMWEQRQQQKQTKSETQRQVGYDD